MLLDTSIASVELYNFTGYDSDGAPTFSIEPFLSHEVALSSLVNSDQDRLEYTTTMIPLPVPPSDSVSAASDGQEPADGSDAGDSNAVHTADQYYGYKVVITISSPVTITYDWAERSAAYAPSRQPLPQAETIVLGTAHTAPTVTTIDEHYRFGSWYLDQACTNAYAGETTPISSYTLYGKWNRYVLINYFWNMWEDDYNYPDVEEQEVIGQIPNVYTPTGVEGYTFSGWYIDPELTTPYTPAALYSDIELYAKWISDSDSDAGNPSGTYPPSTKPSITIPSVTKPTDIKPSDGSQALDSNTPTDGIADAGSSSSGESGVGDKKPSTASSGSNSGPSTQPDASAQGASPKTEDRASLPLWILLLCLSGVVLYAGFHFHGRTQGRG
jgi:uncharacterized repeat protein (TIGR02543 family)